MRIMAVGAHPDDVEFGCGGTLSRWIDEGAEVFLLVATNGDRGDDAGEMTSAELASVRQKEQQEAANVLGVKEVQFLPRSDGSLVYSIELRGEVVRWIRQWKPDIVVTHDPTPFIHDDGTVNHADHRAIGAATLDAVYPFARGRMQYPEQIASGLEPHTVPELYLWGSNHPNHFEDITIAIYRKIEALLCHKSQFKDAEATRTWVMDAAKHSGRRTGVSMAEEFRTLKLV